MKRVVLALTLCACSVSTRNTTIAGSLTTLNAAAAALATYDAQHEQDIVAKATSMADGEKALQAWQAQRTTIALAFDGAWRAIAIAATLNDSQSVVAMLNAGNIVLQELAALGIKVP